MQRRRNNFCISKCERAWNRKDRLVVGGKSYGTKESGNYYRSFRHDECLFAFVLNGSSVSGDVTNNIDLPVNGIISQPARRGRAACLLRDADAFARRRNKCLHRKRKATLPWNPSIYPCPSLSSPAYIFVHACCRLQNVHRINHGGEVNISTLTSLFAKEIIHINGWLNPECKSALLLLERSSRCNYLNRNSKLLRDIGYYKCYIIIIVVILYHYYISNIQSLYKMYY